MLSRSQAKGFFVWGTGVMSFVFIGLTVDTFRQIPAITKEENLTEQVKHGKELWDRSNCMGCHTLLGEGGYYAPELTKVYERRGPTFIKALIKDPESFYPGERKMQRYDFTEAELDALVAFFKWIGEMDLNGYPARASLLPMAVEAGPVVAKAGTQPKIFNQMCIACHSLNGQGGQVGPALDGIGSRKTKAELEEWLTDPTKVKPDSKMPKIPLTKEDVIELAAYLSLLKG